jgi:hypothetical protein
MSEKKVPNKRLLPYPSLEFPDFELYLARAFVSDFELRISDFLPA